MIMANQLIQWCKDVPITHKLLMRQDLGMLVRGRMVGRCGRWQSKIVVRTYGHHSDEMPYKARREGEMMALLTF